MGGKARSVHATARTSIWQLSTVGELRTMGVASDFLPFLDDDLYAPDDAKIWFSDCSLKIQGDLVLDTLPESDTAFYVIAGDLEVSGSIINREGDFGIGLVVLGAVRASNLVAGGSNYYVRGDVKLSGYGIAFYNHGFHHICGTTTAKAVIHHTNTVGGSITPGVQILKWGGHGEHNLSNYVLREFLDGDYPLIEAIIEAALEGRVFIYENKAKSGNALVAKALKKLEQGKTTTHISLEGSKNEFPLELLELHCLQTLNIANTCFTLPEALRDMPKLRELILSSSLGLDQATSIGWLSQLKTLRFKRCNDWFGDEQFKEIGVPLCLGLKNLRELAISQITAKMLRCLPALKTLHILDTGGGTTCIKGGHEGLRKLTIENSRGELKDLSAFPALQEFHITGWHAGKMSAPHELTHLRKVKVKLRPCQPAAHEIKVVRAFWDLPNLEHLDLENTWLAAEDFNGLSRCKSLKYLRLRNATSTDKLSTDLWRGIVSLPDLTTLKLSYKLSPKERATLKATLPNCQITSA